MNERIKTLAKVLGYDEISQGIIKMMGFDMGKFAELIIQECIRVGGPENSYTDEWFNAKADSVAKIKKHFGVEE